MRIKWCISITLLDYIVAWTKEYAREYYRQYHIRNREKKIKLATEWANANREYRLAYLRDYAKRTWKRRAEYKRNRRKTDIQFRLKGVLRHRVTSVLRGYGAKKNFRTTEQMTGCSISDLKSHLESQFKTKMSWENYGNGDGRWNIDHIIPCDAFDLSNLDEQRRCFHYTNLQPLWWELNMKKGARFTSHQPQLF